MPAPSRGLALAGTTLVLAASLSACKGSSSAATSAAARPVATATATRAAAPSAMPSPVATSTAGHHHTSTATSAAGGSSTTGAKACGTQQTSATIGGAHKCIEVGQMCSTKHAADYPQYGFTCEDRNGKAVLVKKA